MDSLQRQIEKTELIKSVVEMWYKRIALIPFIAVTYTDLLWLGYRFENSESEYEKNLCRRLIALRVFEFIYDKKIINLIKDAEKKSKKPLDLSMEKKQLQKFYDKYYKHLKLIRNSIVGHTDKNPTVIYDYCFHGFALKIDDKPVRVEQVGLELMSAIHNILPHFTE